MHSARWPSTARPSYAATGVTRWESNNSRSDVIIEDVRIGNSQKTKDITIAMVETDPGNVDFGVYFDQLSLRNSRQHNPDHQVDGHWRCRRNSCNSATPLLNNPYDLFKLGINGVLSVHSAGQSCNSRCSC
jgi:hypothetical protein